MSEPCYICGGDPEKRSICSRCGATAKYTEEDMEAVHKAYKEQSALLQIAFGLAVQDAMKGNGILQPKQAEIKKAMAFYLQLAKDQFKAVRNA